MQPCRWMYFPRKFCLVTPMIILSRKYEVSMQDSTALQPSATFKKQETNSFPIWFNLQGCCASQANYYYFIVKNSLQTVSETLLRTVGIYLDHAYSLLVTTWLSHTLLTMATSTPISALFLFFLLISGLAAKTPGKRSRYHKPSKRLVVYFRDVLYNGKNANRTTMAGDNHLGDMVAFDDPINLDNNLHSIPVRPAQGFSFYDTRDIFTA